jgi:hypothetical protein
MIKRAEIERRLQLPILAVCLASVGKQTDSIPEAMKLLHDEVEKMVRDAEKR